MVEICVFIIFGINKTLYLKKLALKKMQSFIKHPVVILNKLMIKIFYWQEPKDIKNPIIKTSSMYLFFFVKSQIHTQFMLLNDDHIVPIITF